MRFDNLKVNLRDPLIVVSNKHDCDELKHLDGATGSMSISMDGSPRIVFGHSPWAKIAHSFMALRAIWFPS